MAQSRLYLQVLHGETYLEIPNRREIPLMVYCSYLYQSGWPVLHATYDCSPGSKLHPESSLEPPQLLASALYAVGIYGQGWLDEVNESLQ